MAKEVVIQSDCGTKWDILAEDYGLICELMNLRQDDNVICILGKKEAKAVIAAIKEIGRAKGWKL